MKNQSRLQTALIVGVLLIASSLSMASPSKSKAVVVGEAPLLTSLGQARRLFVVGFAGQVNIIPTPGTNQVTVHATKYMDKEDGGGNVTDALNQLVIRSSNLGNTVEVRASLPPNGIDWTRWAQGKHVPQVKLDINTPENILLEVYWTHGDVHIPHWKSSVLVTSQEGHTAVQDVVGDVTIRSMFGTVKAENIKGTLTVENFSSGLAASDITGKVKIRNFSGETRIKNVTGPVYLSSQKGPVVIQDTQGPMDLQTGIAAIRILDHKGALIGHSDSGAINANLAGDGVDVRLNSTSGPLTVALPARSQASVSLFSSEGHLNAPGSLETQRDSSGHLIRGKLNGGEKGRVRLSSDSGDLSLKVL